MFVNSAEYAILLKVRRNTMIQIFNTHALTSQQRFTRAVIAGTIGAIVIAVVYGGLMQFINIESSLLLIAVGYGIAMVVQKAGRGVQQRFSILGAVLCVFAILIADIITYFGFSALLNPTIWPACFTALMQMYLSLEYRSLLSIIFRAAAVAVAYQYSRIV